MVLEDIWDRSYSLARWKWMLAGMDRKSELDLECNRDVVLLVCGTIWGWLLRHYCTETYEQLKT